MNDTKRDAIRKALERAGSLEALLEGIVRSESEEFRKHQREVEQGTDHPSADLLREYAFGRVSREEDRRLTEHISLCGVCAHEVFRLQYSEDIAQEASTGLFAKLKDFVSNFSFPVSVRALEYVRGLEPEPKEQRYAPGTELIIWAQAPGEGYMAVFHGCEETGKVDLVFPLYPTDDPRVSVGHEIPPVTGKVEGPAGKHWFRVFWTHEVAIDSAQYDLTNESGRDLAVQEFCDRLDEQQDENVRITVVEYDVVSE